VIGRRTGSCSQRVVVGLRFVLSGGDRPADAVGNNGAGLPDALTSSLPAFRTVYFVRVDAPTLSALGTRQGRMHLSHTNRPAE